MKKIQRLFILMLVAIAFGFSGCAYDVPGAYNNEQPYAVQQEDTWSEYACGAFSMAYYLAEQGYIPGNQVSSQAKKLYKKVIFPKTSELYPYSEPIKIVITQSYSFVSINNFYYIFISAKSRSKILCGYCYYI